MQSRMDYLLYHRKSRPSGMQLAGELGITRIKLKKQQGTPLSPMTGIRTLIRWGSAMDLAPSFQPEFTINAASAISLASNKVLTLERLAEHGIIVPPISRTLSGAQSLTFPVLGRSQHGSQGKDIVVYESASAIPTNHSHQFFSQHIPNTREYRIHVIGGEIVRIQGKYCDFPAEQGNGYIKNHSHGYRFRTPDKELNNDRKEAAINAVNALGLDFGAVDLIIGIDRKVYVLEVNTAPAMSPMTLGCYVGGLRKILSRNESRSTFVSYSKPYSEPRSSSTTPSRVRRSDSLRTPPAYSTYWR